jgi:hypothetical protein
MMDRAELVVLHAALETVLAWPDSVRDQVAAWLAPTAQRGNGVGNGADQENPKKLGVLDAPPPRQAKARRRPNAFTAQTIERKLLGALRDNPGLSERAAANAASVSRAQTSELLRQMAARGAVAKDSTGRWRLKDGPPGPPPAGEEAGRPPMQPPAG